MMLMELISSFHIYLLLLEAMLVCESLRLRPGGVVMASKLSSAAGALSFVGSNMEGTSLRPTINNRLTLSRKLTEQGERNKVTVWKLIDV